MAKKPLRLAYFHRAVLRDSPWMIARRQLCMIECAQRSLTGRLGPTRFRFAGCFVMLRFAGEWVTGSVVGGKRAATLP